MSGPKKSLVLFDNDWYMLYCRYAGVNLACRNVMMSAYNLHVSINWAAE